MTVLIAVYNGDECIGRCDARCYDAEEEACECICGGKNHGTGKQQALDNTRDQAESWLEQARAGGQNVTLAEIAMDAQCVPLFGLTEAGAPMGAVTYHGTHNGSAGAGAVEVIEDGRVTGLLHHVVRHSPTGFSWGYAGSGPADLARSLLIAALGDEAKCPDCKGSQKIGWNRTTEQDEPYDPARASDYEPETVGKCYCDDGYRNLPYQDFKFQFVAGWGDQWRISRDEIRTWYLTQPAND